MSAAAISPEQIRVIHAIKTRARLDDGSYRAMLSEYGAASSKDLTEADAARFLGRLRLIPGAEDPATRSPSVVGKAEGRYGRKLQAMWLSLYNLGVVRDRSDAAMHAFLEGRTGIPHTRFLRGHADAAKAVEALKAWMVREGVRWPASSGDRERDLLLMKREILRAQWIRGCALGVFETSLRPEDCDGAAKCVSAILLRTPRPLALADLSSMTAAELDKVAAAAGRKIRDALKAERSAHV